MQAFETFDHAGCVIELHYDDNPTPPSEWDTLGTLYAFRVEYVGMEEAHPNAQEAMERGGVALLVRYLRYCGIHAIPYDIWEHSGMTIRECNVRSDRCSGYIAADAVSIEKTGVELANVADGLRSELDEWGTYFEGGVVGYVVTCKGETVASCWGFYPDKSTSEDPHGLNYVRVEAREEAEHEQKQRADAEALGIPTR